MGTLRVSEEGTLGMPVDGMTRRTVIMTACFELRNLNTAGASVPTFSFTSTLPPAQDARPSVVYAWIEFN